MVNETGELRRHSLVSGRGRVAAPIEPDTLPVYHGHLTDSPAAVGAQGGRLQVEEDQRSGAEGAVRPRAHL
jgi:hypothetical protein